MPSQIPLHLETAASLTRADFILAEGNRDALAFVESWPGWAVPRAAIYGPPACGKSHIAEIWSARSGAQRVSAAALSGSAFVLLDRSYPIVVEDVDSSLPNPARDTAIFELLESASLGAPVLVTGRTDPPSWPVTLPDLGSRFSSLVSFSVWAADAELLRKLAQKLFRDRQLAVPASLIDRMLTALERSPQAIRDFVGMVDARALAERRPVNSALIRDVLADLGCNMTDSGDLFNFGHEVARNSPDAEGKS